MKYLELNENKSINTETCEWSKKFPWEKCIRLNEFIRKQKDLK